MEHFIISLVIAIDCVKADQAAAFSNPYERSREASSYWVQQPFFICKQASRADICPEMAYNRNVLSYNYQFHIMI
jgi:hypothetical protein